jgi:hypothetical protein
VSRAASARRDNDDALDDADDVRMQQRLVLP